MASKGVSIPISLDIDTSDIRKQGQALSNILERALNKNTRAKALDKLEKQIAQARDDMKILQGAITRLMNTPTHTKIFDDAIKQAQDYKAKVKEAIDVWKNQNPKYAGMSNKAIIQALSQSGGTYGNRLIQTPSFGLVNIQKTVKELQRAQKLCDDLVKTGKAFEINQGAIDILKTELGESEEKVRNLLLQLQQMSYGNGNWIQNMVQPLVNFNQEIRQTMGSLSQAFGPYVQAATVAVNALAEALKLVVKGLRTIGVAAISAFKPLVSLAQGAASTIGKMFDSIKKHNETTMKNLWRNVLRYGIGVRSMYFLVRKIRAVIGDVINELSRQIPEVNAQMSAFKTAVNGLKGALATAFQPILTAVLPALTALINAVSRAVAVVGKFIALLTGQNFVYAATATQVDYAASLDKTGKSAKKAKKELEGYLSPIDEINKYQSKRDDDSDSGGGGGDAAPFTLKKVPIEDWIKDLWDKIKAAWEHADFTKLGKMLGDKLARMLANIPWAEIRAKARQLGRSLATLLNGIMYGEWNGKALATYIGETIAGAINTGFDLADSFIEAFDFSELGKSIMEIIAGVLDNLDWNLITGTFARLGTGIGNLLAEIFNDNATWAKAGEALARAINALIYGIFNIFNEIEGAQVGAAISRFLNKFIEWIDSKAFVTTCNEIMRDLLDALIVAVTTTNWDELGAKLAEIISGIDFKGIFKRYVRLANVIIDAILDLLEEFLNGLTPDKLTEIGESIADTINNIDFQPERLADVVNRLFEALLTIARTATKDVDWNEIGEDIGKFLSEINWKEIISGAVEILNGIKDGLWDLLDSALYNAFGEIGRDAIMGFIMALKVLGSTLLHSAMGPFKVLLDAIKAFFGIHSPSTVFFDIGLMIVEGFINGIKSIVEKAKQIWERVKANAELLWFSIKLAITNKAREIYENVINKFIEIKTRVTEKVNEIKQNVTTTWEDMKSSVISIFEGMWNGIKSVINSILAGIEGMVNGIIKGINFAADALNTLQIDPPEWMKTKYGIGTIGFNIPTLSEVSLPRLAQGAVIPPNKEFMAVLGDQKNGTNIETPLSTMVEAFNQALRSSDVGGVKQINFLLPDRRTLAQYTIAGGRVIQTSTGKNPFELA